MKKLFFFAAGLVTLAACNKTESLSISNPEEIGFFNMVQNETRGYVVSNKFEDTQNPDVFGQYSSTYLLTNENHSSVKAKCNDREMVVSAYNKTDKQDYFQEVVFSKNSNSIWTAKEGPMYWPLGKDLEFLTYSSKNIEIDSLGKKRDEIEANWVSAKKVTFDVTPYQCYQNDILYAQTCGNNRGNKGTTTSQSDKGLQVTYHHAQAWLTFNVWVDGNDCQADPNTAGTEHPDSARVKIDKIVLENVYNSGVLSFEYNDTASVTQKPIAKWNFFTQNPTDVVVDDAWNVLARGKNGFLYVSKYGKTDDPTVAIRNGFQLNMLMPEQDHNDFVLYYTMNKKQDSVVLPFKNKSVITAAANGAFDDQDEYNTDNGTNKVKGTEQGRWNMGFHYIYNIKITINEITFDPQVEAWVNVTGFNPATQAL